MSQFQMEFCDKTLLAELTIKCHVTMTNFFVITLPGLAQGLAGSAYIPKGPSVIVSNLFTRWHDSFFSLTADFWQMFQV